MTNLSTKLKHLSLCFLLVFMFFMVVGSGIAVPIVEAQGPDDANRKASLEATKSGFVPLVGIPYVDTIQPMSLATYVNALYLAAISIAAFLAVVKIIFAGVKYMLSDVVTSKEDAKKDIRGALIGLLIVIGAVLILNTVNPQLTGLTALDGPGPAIRLSTNKPELLNVFPGDTTRISYQDPGGGEKIKKWTESCADNNGIPVRTIYLSDGNRDGGIELSCNVKSEIIVDDKQQNSEISSGSEVGVINANTYTGYSDPNGNPIYSNGEPMSKIDVQAKQRELIQGFAKECGVTYDEIIAVSRQEANRVIRYYCP